MDLTQIKMLMMSFHLSLYLWAVEMRSLVKNRQYQKKQRCCNCFWICTNRNNIDAILFVFIFVFVGCWSAIHGGKQVIAEETAMRHSTSGHQSCTTSYLWALVSDSSSKSLNIQIRNTELRKKTQLQSSRPTRVLQHKQLDAECGQQLPIKVSQKEKKVREAQQKSKASDVSNS